MENIEIKLVNAFRNVQLFRFINFLSIEGEPNYIHDEKFSQSFPPFVVFNESNFSGTKNYNANDDSLEPFSPDYTAC